MGSGTGGKVRCFLLDFCPRQVGLLVGFLLVGLSVGSLLVIVSPIVGITVGDRVGLIVGHLVLGERCCVVDDVGRDVGRVVGCDVVIKGSVVCIDAIVVVGVVVGCLVGSRVDNRFDFRFLEDFCSLDVCFFDDLQECESEFELDSDLDSGFDTDLNSVAARPGVSIFVGLFVGCGSSSEEP